MWCFVEGHGFLQRTVVKITPQEEALECNRTTWVASSQNHPWNNPRNNFFVHQCHMLPGCVTCGTDLSCRHMPVWASFHETAASPNTLILILWFAFFVESCTSACYQIPISKAITAQLTQWPHKLLTLLLIDALQLYWKENFQSYVAVSLICPQNKYPRGSYTL